ncbi:DUF411 domain-containing protein [Campylobacter sp. 2018MI35]|uniref:DUF411 domain-containing protein n=1 Tax=unclassified Campylobacter TaxID=2593542 RepID=UPI001908C779|nr:MULTISPECIES: DUF411 domain-containing protein [unclassified Campylobacter]MBK1971095.1 DUF411 domain-containing protein [Campylobacter sp. TTU_617]MBK1992145.1 DUF411 domain-containing protein [Campylobacter sp. 2018MI34]
MKKAILNFCLIAPLSLLAATKTIEVYESPTCGCCDLWVSYMKKKGYEVNVHKTNDFLKIKENYKINPYYQSCHTGVIDGYAIEGHVPEDAISWLLTNKPKDVIGISAPGMPQGSPGMEQGYEEEYPVILMYKDGSYKIFAYYKGEKIVKNVNNK